MVHLVLLLWTYYCCDFVSGVFVLFEENVDSRIGQVSCTPRITTAKRVFANPKRWEEGLARERDLKVFVGIVGVTSFRVDPSVSFAPWYTHCCTPYCVAPKTIFCIDDGHQLLLLKNRSDILAFVRPVFNRQGIGWRWYTLQVLRPRQRRSLLLVPLWAHYYVCRNI